MSGPHNDNKDEVYEIARLTNALVSSDKPMLGGDRMMEEITFTFERIQYEHKVGK